MAKLFLRQGKTPAGPVINSGNPSDLNSGDCLPRAGENQRWGQLIYEGKNGLGESLWKLGSSSGARPKWIAQKWRSSDRGSGLAKSLDDLRLGEPSEKPTEVFRSSQAQDPFDDRALVLVRFQFLGVRVPEKGRGKPVGVRNAVHADILP